jgi:hypothetical protein
VLDISLYVIYIDVCVRIRRIKHVFNHQNYLKSEHTNLKIQHTDK